MKIWKLTPLEPNARAWEQSYYQGVVFVRASSADEARKRAEVAYRKAPPKIPGDHSEFGECPWLEPDQVSAKNSDDSGYSVEGDPEIVGPEDARQHENDP